MTHLSPTYQCYIAATSIIKEPTTSFEDVKDHRWVDGMQTEIKALDSNHTWKISDLPPGKKLLVVGGYTK